MLLSPFLLTACLWLLWKAWRLKVRCVHVVGAPGRCLFTNVVSADWRATEFLHKRRRRMKNSSIVRSWQHNGHSKPKPSNHPCRRRQRRRRSGGRERGSACRRIASSARHWRAAAAPWRRGFQRHRSGEATPRRGQRQQRQTCRRLNAGSPRQEALPWRRAVLHGPAIMQGWTRAVCGRGQGLGRPQTLWPAWCIPPPPPCSTRQGGLPWASSSPHASPAAGSSRD